MIKLGGSACLVAMVLAFALGQETGEPEAVIHARDLKNSEVIGFLGTPMGRVVEIEAVIVSGDATRMKRYASQYLLRVESVSGQELETQRNFAFMVPGHLDAGISNDSSDLYKLKHSSAAKALSSEEIAALEEGYVGSRVRLAVYEVGGFGGVPENLPSDIAIWASPDFHFSTQLVVLKQIEEKHAAADFSKAH